MKKNRTSLFVASEIARVYQKDSKHEIALKFYERISKSYRKDKWFDLLCDVCSRMVEASIALNQPKSLFESLFEQMATAVPEQLLSINEKLLQWTNNTALNIEVDMDRIQSFLTVDALFDVTSVHVQGNPQWQLVISNMTNVSLPTSISVRKVIVNFSNNAFDHEIYPSEETSTNLLKKFIYAADKNVADLTLKPMSTVVFQKTFQPTEAEDLCFAKITLMLQANETEISLVYNISDRKVQKRRWLSDNMRWIELPSNKNSKDIRYLKYYSSC